MGGYGIDYNLAGRGHSSSVRGVAAANYYALQQQQHHQLQRQSYSAGGSMSARNLPLTSNKSGCWPQSGSVLRRPSIRGAPSTAVPHSLRLSRVRSEEVLDTRSEPDLRPLAMTQNPYLNNSEVPYYSEEIGVNSRWFVALYDYNHHMSPNPNAQQEELSFRKHQLIKVIFNLTMKKNVFIIF